MHMSIVFFGLPFFFFFFKLNSFMSLPKMTPPKNRGGNNQMMCGFWLAEAQKTK